LGLSPHDLTKLIFAVVLLCLRFIPSFFLFRFHFGAVGNEGSELCQTGRMDRTTNNNKPHASEQAKPKPNKQNKTEYGKPCRFRLGFVSPGVDISRRKSIPDNRFEPTVCGGLHCFLGTKLVGWLIVCSVCSGAYSDINRFFGASKDSFRTLLARGSA
jgi:hypothetical protein